MVKFSVFNEMSLPFHSEHEVEAKFGIFFKLLKELKSKGLTTIRMDRDFRAYPILENITFQQFFGQIESREFKTKMRSFIGNGISKVDSPLIKIEEVEEERKIIENEYFYNGVSTQGGLACCDIWNTLTISFLSDEQWNKNKILLNKEMLTDDGILSSKNIIVPHASNIEHLNLHSDFFEVLEDEKRLEFSLSNFWTKRYEIFPDKILFVDEVEKQLEKLDSRVFEKALAILRDIETSKRVLEDFDISGEGETVSSNTKLRKLREFKLDGKIEFFEKHIKNLPNGYRIYFLERDEKIYIGYIGKHLPTKKF